MEHERAIGRRFHEALGASASEAEDETAGARLRRAIARAPAVDPLAFAAHVASVCTGTLDDLALDDLALAFACVHGDLAALAELERTMIEPMPRTLARMRPDPKLVDEVRQAVRERLLLPSARNDDGRARLLDFRGTGPLGAWVRVVAMRLAYDRLREGSQTELETDAEAFERLADASDAPDVAYLRETHMDDVKAAFAEAAAKLGSEERLVLRAHVVDGLTIDQIGALYQVHRATAARWIQHAKEALVDALREALGRRIGASPSACESLVMLVGSRIDLSLERVL
ncbi:MAG: hypothetical protein QM702_21165 [Rubrivivax sp.]